LVIVKPPRLLSNLGGSLQMSIPCTLLFENGIPKEKVQGYKPYGKFETYLEQKIESLTLTNRNK
ncbi:MAG: hypothetical protein ABGA11_09080, partial [Liquorilactobacillus hordei]